MGSSAASTALSSGVSCPTTYTVVNQYLLQSYTQTWDLNGTAFPTVTKTLTPNADGDPLTIITTTTNGSATATLTDSYVYQADQTSCSSYNTCTWLLGLATQHTISSSVPSTILGTSAGSGPNATATAGSLPLAGNMLTSGLAFGGVLINASAVQQTATLTNDGVNAITVTLPTAASVTGAGFSFSSTNCPASLAPSAECETVVSFVPTVTGSASGTLTVTTNAGTFNSTLTGTGTQGTASVSPTPLAIPATQVGQTSAAQSVTVTNNGTGLLTVSAAAVSGTGFALASNNCATVAVNGACQVTVTYSPTTTGAVSETFAYGDNSNNALNINRLTQYTVAGAGIPGLARFVTLQYNAVGTLLGKGRGTVVRWFTRVQAWGWIQSDSSGVYPGRHSSYRGIRAANDYRSQCRRRSI